MNRRHFVFPALSGTLVVLALVALVQCDILFGSGEYVDFTVDGEQKRYELSAHGFERVTDTEIWDVYFWQKKREPEPSIIVSIGSFAVPSPGGYIGTFTDIKYTDEHGNMYINWGRTCGDVFARVTIEEWSASRVSGSFEGKLIMWDKLGVSVPHDDEMYDWPCDTPGLYVEVEGTFVTYCNPK